MALERQQSKPCPTAVPVRGMGPSWTSPVDWRPAAHNNPAGTGARAGRWWVREKHHVGINNCRLPFRGVVGFVKNLSLSERSVGVFSSSLTPVWHGKQQGYKHGLERALGIPEPMHCTVAVVEGWMHKPWLHRFYLENCYLPLMLSVC